MLQYYNRPFLYFHKGLNKEDFNGTNHIRQSFWTLIPKGQYDYVGGKQLFEQYFKSLERRIEEIVSKYSIAYWLHLSRRILPNSLGEDKTPVTILIIRSILNSAIQKYGQNTFCSHVGKSKEIEISKVFNGLLLSDEFEIERRILELGSNQLVLTDFNQLNLIEYYNLEKLCYEVWYCEAKMRALQKGAVIEVDIKDKEFIKEYRTREIDQLITSYDQRKDGGFFSSATGTVFTAQSLDRGSDLFIPYLNLEHVKIDGLNEMFEKVFNFTAGKDYVPNFLLIPIPLSKFIKAHLPFDEDFTEKNGVSFQLIVLVITALCFRYFYISASKKYPAVVTIIQRGYEGPLLYRDIIEEILYYKEHARAILQINFEFSKKQIKKAVEYLTLRKKDKINLMYSGTLKMFLPVGEGRMYIDYSLIIDILNNLFFDIDLNKHNFRGQTLEIAINENKSYLPTKPCKNLIGEKKQIDFSVKMDRLLIIGECKVVAKSLGFYTGDIKALNHRNEKVISRGLSEVDEKANWLAMNPIGRNYNLADIDYILPVVISPFREYIPSLDKYYWINESIPRVLSIFETKELVSDTPNMVFYNLVKVNKS
jgi:hypothetical protein